MTQRQLSELQNRLNGSMPPMDPELLHEITHLEWSPSNEEELDLLCEIIIRVGADAIMCAYDLSGDQRDLYYSVFIRILEKATMSDLHRISSDFRSYVAS